eukprot:TRINITY_DN1825_c0_g1_i1.p1 TRINITY_DN1825_c0_g1~~TRINITY_DN1825_c0_g1_i1.p1  ORF type:complete len:286 (-),score=102.59 TRINITY_DN1825_c0_g1_i1:41-898(-)
MIALVTLLLCVATVEAHMKGYYEPFARPIRNAANACKDEDGECKKDGQFSVATDYCGGVTEYGANGVGRVAVGEVVTLKFNYGTGVNGDHQSAANRFRVAFIDMAGLSVADFNAKMADLEGDHVLDKDIVATGGSRQDAYYSTIKIPYACEECVIVVADQRRWGACWDVRAGVVPTPAPTPMPPFQNDVCGNGKVEAGEECEPDVQACCTAECKYAARNPGCPCSRQFECADSYYCSCTGLDDCAAREIVDPVCQREMPEKLGAAAKTVASAAAATVLAAAAAVL